MERKRGDGVLWEVAELFDLPGEMVGTLPHLELLGDKQLYLERHRGILSYSEEVLDINTPAGVLRLRGTGLRILSMTAEALRIMNEKIKDRELTKRYLCIVHGTPSPRAGKIEGYLVKDAKKNQVFLSKTSTPGA